MNTRTPIFNVKHVNTHIRAIPFHNHSCSACTLILTAHMLVLLPQCPQPIPHCPFSLIAYVQAPRMRGATVTTRGRSH